MARVFGQGFMDRVVWLVEDRIRVQGWLIVTVCGEVASRG